MIANRFTSAAAALACLLLACPAGAMDHRPAHGGHYRHFRADPAPGFRVGYLDRWHRHHFVENSRWDRQGDGRRNRPAEIARGDDGAGYIRSRTRQIGGFYGGALEAYPVSGNGIYFVRDDDAWLGEGAAVSRPVPMAKVIDVEQTLGAGPSGSADPCSYEHGVCVIRGGR